jgi:hypothetical protein
MENKRIDIDPETRITLYYDFYTLESKKTKELIERFGIPSNSIISEPTGNRSMPFIFSHSVATSIRGFEEIKYFLFEQIQKDRSSYYSSIRLFTK